MKLVHTQDPQPRHLVDIMYEFIAEFENLKYLACWGSSRTEVATAIASVKTSVRLLVGMA
jgi:hypothetical protein